MVQVPDHTMAILLGLGFCVVAPLIAPIALLYFLVCTLIGKYQMVYVFTPSFQSGGRVCLNMPLLVCFYSKLSCETSLFQQVYYI